MKGIIALFVLSCLSLCFVGSVEITTWGITDPDANLLGRESVYAERYNYGHQLRVVQFPMVTGNESNRKFPITLIKHFNYDYKLANVSFVYGGINDSEVVILIKSKLTHGINSTFEFWGYGL